MPFGIKKWWESVLYTGYEVSSLMAAPSTNPVTSYMPYSNFVSPNFVFILPGYHTSMKMMSKGSAEYSMCSGDVEE